MFVICIVALFVNKATIGTVLNYGLDFVGGTSTQITFDNTVNVDQSLKSEIESIFKSSTGTNEVELSDVEGENAILVKTKELSVEENDALTEALVSSDYNIQEGNIQTETISTTVSGEMKQDAIVADNHCFYMYADIYLDTI